MTFFDIFVDFKTFLPVLQGIFEIFSFRSSKIL